MWCYRAEEVFPTNYCNLVQSPLNEGLQNITQDSCCRYLIQHANKMNSLIRKRCFPYRTRVDLCVEANLTSLAGVLSSTLSLVVL